MQPSWKFLSKTLKSRKILRWAEKTPAHNILWAGVFSAHLKIFRDFKVFERNFQEGCIKFLKTRRFYWRELRWVSENTAFSFRRIALGFSKYCVFLSANCVGFLKIQRFPFSELRWVSQNTAFSFRRIALGFAKQGVFLKEKCVGFLLTSCIKTFQKAWNLAKSWDEPKKPGLIWSSSRTDHAPGAQKPNVIIFYSYFLIDLYFFMYRKSKENIIEH